jgi:hypothetical protein
MAFQFDGETKIISLSLGTTSMSIRDLWSRWVDWFLTGDNSKYPVAMEQVGGNPVNVTDGVYIPVYIFLYNGWKLRPQEATHTLNVKDGILVVNGGGDPFVNTLGTFIVRVNYSQPVQALTVATGGGSGGATLSEIENSSILAKEATVLSSTTSLKNHITAMTQ